MIWQLPSRLGDILLCTDPGLGDPVSLVWLPADDISSRTPVLGVAALTTSCAMLTHKERSGYNSLVNNKYKHLQTTEKNSLETSVPVSVDDYFPRVTSVCNS